MQKTIANSKIPVNFKSIFVEELVGFLGVIYPKKEGKTSISIRVNELFVAKRTLSDKDTGYTAVVLAVIQRKKVMII